MFNSNVLLANFTSQNLGVYYPNYVNMNQNMLENQNSKNSLILSSYISYAVSMDFKKFQTQYLLKNIVLNESKVQTQQIYHEQNNQTQTLVLRKEFDGKYLNVKNKKNITNITEQINILSDQEEKIQKDQSKSKAITIDQSQHKLQFDQIPFKQLENQKKIKKERNIQKRRDLSQINLIQYAEIKYSPFERSELLNKKNSLIMRQVQNWNQTQKSRRHQKLQLRRIKY